MSSVINEKVVTINNERFRLFISEDEIQKRVEELAKEIERDYSGQTPIFIGILNGAFIFFSDLIRRVDLDCEIDFFKLSSYGDAKISSGNVKLLKDLNCQVTGRDIIIVEDIIDSGISIGFIKQLIMKQNPRSFAVVTLLYKSDCVRIDFKVDYIGFQIPNHFVVGYGLDYAQKARNLRSIYILDK
ncbi:MAG TPA: hypoxanthine phosphoribosyltransferase [Candidatus Acidoferrales bacterium]|nr:hypoxanthine phosphoribosyltransferase [Candidatus Acidoferrales bacterium]